jgi:phage gp16-like protein
MLRHAKLASSDMAVNDGLKMFLVLEKCQQKCQQNSTYGANTSTIELRKVKLDSANRKS